MCGAQEATEESQELSLFRDVGVVGLVFIVFVFSVSVFSVSVVLGWNDSCVFCFM